MVVGGKKQLVHGKGQVGHGPGLPDWVVCGLRASSDSLVSDIFSPDSATFQQLWREKSSPLLGLLKLSKILDDTVARPQNERIFHLVSHRWHARSWQIVCVIKTEEEEGFYVN